MLKPTDIALLRLMSQQIISSEFKTAKQLVHHMGAMQAQDYAMAKWAVGLRVPGATEQKIEAAISKGDIIRTHVLRPTWHFVAAEDIHWMLELSKPNIGTALKSRHKALELSDAMLVKTNKLLGKLLEGDKHLTREELVAALHKANIKTNDNRSSHILMQAELDGLISSGQVKNGKHTYTLLDGRVKKKKDLPAEEAHAKLAERYFFSHGPATLADFTWWSGLGIRSAREGLEAIKKKLVSEKIGSETYWMKQEFHKSKTKSSVQLLPAFDEYLISYKNRTASLLKEHHKKTFSANGIFWPTLVVNGQVKGLWKRSIKNDAVSIGTELFHAQDKITAAQLKKAADAFGKFLGKKAVVIE